MKIFSTLALLIVAISVRAQIITGPNTVASGGGIVAANNGSDFGNAILTSSNIAIMMLSPVAGNNAWTDPGTKTGQFDHQLGESWFGSGRPVMWWYDTLSNTTPKWRGDFAYAQPINAGDTSKSSTNNNGSTQWIYNGHPLLWNLGGDAFFQVVNMSTNVTSSGAGFGMARVDIVAGIPTINDNVSIDYVLTKTNVNEGLLPGWSYVIANYDSGNVRGQMWGGFTGLGPDSGNFGAMYFDASNKLVRIPKWVAGTHTPNTSGWLDIATFDPNGGNITLGRSNNFVYVTNLLITAAGVTAAGSGNAFSVGSDDMSISGAKVVSIGSQSTGNGSGIAQFGKYQSVAGGDNQFTAGNYGMGVDGSANIHIVQSGSDLVGFSVNTMSGDFGQSKVALFATDGFTNTVPVFGKVGFGSYSSNKLALTTITVTASPFSWTNTTFKNVYVIGGGGTVSALSVNGTALPSAFLTGSDTIPLQPGEYFTSTYTVAPTYLWKPF